MLSEFVSKKANNTLEAYIRDEDKAWAEDLDGETRVYLVKDKSENVALFFSVKCGLADHRLDTKTESTEIGQSENTINVPNCISAIELRHLCKNEGFVVPAEVDIPFGM